MASPVFIQLPPALRGQIMRRAHGERGASLARRPMFAAAESGADPQPRKSGGAQLVVYRDGPGDYRAVAIVPWFCRDASGQRLPCRFAIELKIDRMEEEEGAIAGADLGASVIQSVARPILDKIQAVLNHPLAALAASASVLIPGVGPAYLVGYAVSQSLVDYAERKSR